jgi:hypothetical protein
LRNPTKKLATRRLFLELKELKNAPPSKEWLEAAVLVSVLRLARPRNAVGFLNLLWEMAVTPEEKSHFSAFYMEISKYLAPLIITNHGYLEELFVNAPHKEIWDGVENHMTILKNAGCRVLLNSGTLLGLVRDGELIGHDNDIGLAIILDAETPEDAAIEWKAFPQKLSDLGIFSEGSQEYNGFLRLTPIAGFEVDIFPGWFANDKVYIYPHTYGELEAKDVYPFRTCKITGLNQPAEPEKMLKINYGEGWNVPDLLFKFRKPNYFKDFMNDTK